MVMLSWNLFLWWCVAESFPATMLTQPPDSDSDSDVEDHIPLRRQAKRATIESDSDDEW